VNVVINLRVSSNAEEFLISQAAVVFSRGIRLCELVSQLVSQSATRQVLGKK
jgi:hypothetical protein